MSSEKDTETPSWRIHKWGGVNFEVLCPTNPDRLTIVPKVNPLVKVVISLPDEVIICSCCNTRCQPNTVTKIFVNNCIWAFKITRKDSEVKQCGKVSTRILPILIDLDIDPWEKIHLVIIPNPNEEDDIRDAQVDPRTRSSQSEPPKRSATNQNLFTQSVSDIERKKDVELTPPLGRNNVGLSASQDSDLSKIRTNSGRVSPFSLSKTEDGNTSPKSNFVITTSPRTKENTALNNSDEPQTTSSTPLPKPLPRILTPSATCHFPSSSSRNPRDSNPRDFSSQNSLEMEGIQTSPRAASPRQLLSTREGTGNFLVRSPRGPVAGENNDIVLKTNSPRKPREDSFRNLKVVMTEKKTSMNLNYAAFPKKGKVGSTKLKEVGPIPSEPVPSPSEEDVVQFNLSQVTVNTIPRPGSSSSFVTDSFRRPASERERKASQFALGSGRK